MLLLQQLVEKKGKQQWTKTANINKTQWSNSAQNSEQNIEQNNDLAKKKATILDTKNLEPNKCVFAPVSVWMSIQLQSRVSQTDIKQGLLLKENDNTN